MGKIKEKHHNNFKTGVAITTVAFNLAPMVTPATLAALVAPAMAILVTQATTMNQESANPFSASTATKQTTAKIKDGEPCAKANGETYFPKNSQNRQNSNESSNEGENIDYTVFLLKA